MTFFTRAITYFSMMCMVLSPNIMFGIGVMLGLGALSPGDAWATEKNTELLDSLVRKYDLNDPSRNHQSAGLSQTIKDRLDGSSVDMSQIITDALNRMDEGTDYDFSASANTAPASQILQQQRGVALSIGQTHMAPAQDGSGNIQMQYATQATRALTYDDNGNIVINVVEDDVDMVSELSVGDYASNEVYNGEHEFDAPSAYNDKDAVHEQVASIHNSYVGGTTSSARAYQMITTNTSRVVNTRVDENSPWLQPTKDHISQFNNNGGEFYQSCTNVTETTTQNMYFPTVTEHQCQTFNTRNEFQCEIEREVRIPLVVQGNNVSSCGTGCFEVKFLSPNDGANNGWQATGCERFDVTNMVTINTDDGFVLETVTMSGSLDDHMALYVDGDMAVSIVDKQKSYSIPLPGSNHPRCESKTYNIPNDTAYQDISWSMTNLIDEPGQHTYNMTAGVLVKDKGELNLSVKFQFRDTEGLGFGEIVTQSPEGCADKVTRQIYNGRGVVPMLDSGLTEEDIDYSFCRFDQFTVLDEGSNGYPVEVIDALGPLFPGDTGDKTFHAELTGYKCDPLGGNDFCVIDPISGELNCLDWQDFREAPDQCAEYVANDSCSEVRRTCTPGWEDSDLNEWNEEDICFNETVDFECETGNTYSHAVSQTTNVCEAALPCSGGDCDMGETEQNDRFIDAAVQANIIQNMDADATCNATPSGDYECEIFKGQVEYCSWSTAGSMGMDCCEEAKGVDILAYISAAQGINKLHSLSGSGVLGQTAENAATAVDGAFDYVAKGAESAWTTLSEPITSSEVYKATTDFFTSTYESLLGNAADKVIQEGVQAGANTAAGEAAAQGTLATIQNEVAVFFAENLPDELSNLLFDTVTDEVSGEITEAALNETVSNIFSNVMLAYQIYSLAKLALTLLTACDENELDMPVKLAQRLCYKVGRNYCSSEFLGVCYQKRQDYCCYNSILARVVMSQLDELYPHKDFGSCRGLVNEETNLIGDPRIDLSEWVDLMLQAGIVMDEANEELLTGNGEITGQRCEEYEVTDPVTLEVTMETQCFDIYEGGQMTNLGARQTVSERTLDRMEHVEGYASQVNDATVEMLNNLDCSKTPKPPVCDFGIDPNDAGGD